MTKITELPSGTPEDADLIEFVDVSDTTLAPTGTNKSVLWSAIKPVAGVPEAPIDGTPYARQDGAWVSGGGGGMVEIETITDPVSGEFDFTNIPQTYKRLVVKGSVRSAGGAAVDILSCYFNGDNTAGNYHNQRQAANNGIGSYTEASTPEIAIIPDNNSPAGSFGDMEITLEGYANTKLKTATSTFTTYNDVTSQWSGVGHVAHKTMTAAMASLRFEAVSSCVGTLTLYGES